MKHHLHALVVTVVLVAGTGTARAGWNAADTEKAIELAKVFVEPQSEQKLQTPGMSVAVSRNGKVVFARGFGYALPTVRVVPETVFHIGSLSKQFTAAATLRLISRGACLDSGRILALTTPVSEILPQAHAWALSDGDRINIRHLLTMTSNLPNFTRRPPPSTDPWGSIQAPTLLKALEGVKPLTGPGSFGYSNTAYFLLAELMDSSRLELERHGGYKDIIRALWRDVGLPDTSFASDSTVGKRLAGPNYTNYKRRPAFIYGDWLKGSADVLSTVLDLQAWNKALYQEQVLPRSMLDEMFSEAARVDVWTWYGMGWFVREKDGIIYYTHSGSLPGFTSFNMIAQKKGSSDWVSVTALTNSYGVEGLDVLADDLTGLAFQD